jgi:hypothetical protein
LPNAESAGSGLFAHKTHTKRQHQQQQQQQQQQQSIERGGERQYELPLKDIIQVSNQASDAPMTVHTSMLLQHIIACAACCIEPLVPDNVPVVYSHAQHISACNANTTRWWLSITTAVRFGVRHLLHMQARQEHDLVSLFLRRHVKGCTAGTPYMTGATAANGSNVIRLTAQHYPAVYYSSVRVCAVCWQVYSLIDKARAAAVETVCSNNAGSSTTVAAAAAAAGRRQRATRAQAQVSCSTKRSLLMKRSSFV